MRAHRVSVCLLATLATACSAASDGDSLDDFVTGGERPSDRPTLPIVNGTEATDYAEAVQINMKQNGYQVSACSGAVIAPRLVLTAGHCIVGFDGWDVIAPYAGGLQKSSSSQALVYDWTETGPYVNPDMHDLGVIVLDSDIVLSVYPEIAKEGLPAGTEVLNIGRIRNGAIPDNTLYVSQPVPVYDGSEYGFPYDYAATEVIESGDSGGPVVLPSAPPRTIVAVNSGAGGGLQVLARTDLLHSWIAEQVNAHGGAVPPDPDPPTVPECAHDICAEGGVLDAACGSCVSTICTQDPYCCSNAWDGQCVNEVASICGQGTCVEPEPEDPCGGVTWEGVCSSGQLSWCESDQVKSIDCSAYGKICGWDSANGYYNCL